MAGITFARLVTDCELLKSAVEAELPTLPHLTEEHSALEAFLAEARALLARQESLRGEKQDVTRLRQAAEAKGQDLYNRAAAVLRGKMGFQNQQLLRFGVNPRKARTRRSKNAGPAPPITPTTPTPTPTPPAVTPQGAECHRSS
jgi:hypothetical protein